MTGEIVDGYAWRNFCISMSLPIPISFAIDSISCRYAEDSPIIFVVDISLSRKFSFIRLCTSISVHFMFLQFCDSNTDMGIFAAVSAGRSDITVKNFVVDTVIWHK